MNSYLKTLLATVATLLVGAFVQTASAQVTGGTQLLPILSPVGLTDLNNVILFRSNHPGNQAFDGALNVDEYIVGPGDEIEVNIWTPSARLFLMTVTPEGTLLIPAVGEVRVSGLSLALARKTILDATAESFPGSEITATLVSARRVRVYVSGFVQRPGTFELSANQRLGDAVAMAGDVLPDVGSARNITVKAGGQTRSFDLLKFYSQGDMDQNPYLKGGDHIRVAPREPEVEQVQIAGAVPGPGWLEFRAGDRVSDLIAFAFGFQPGADLDQIILSRTPPGSGIAELHTVTARIENGELVVSPDMEVRRRDRLFVSFHPDTTRTATVALYGEVLRPGHYATVDGKTMLSELIESAGGILPGASAHEMVFLRNAFPSDTLGEMVPPLVSTSLPLLMEGDFSFDVPLRNFDSIFIPAISPGIQMIGQVKRPGLLTYVPNETVAYYLERAGGFGFKADKGNIHIVRAVSGAEEYPDGAGSPKPGDQIVIPIKNTWSTGQRVRNILTMLGAAATAYLAVESIVN